MVTGVLLFTTFLLCAVPLFVLGFLIRERKKLHLINGIDLEHVPDRDALADWLGLTCYRLGTLTLLAGIGLAAAPHFALPILAVYALAALIALALLGRGIARYRRPAASV